MKVVIDRFEGNYAVCEKEDRTMINIDKAKVPCDAKEGDVLIIKENEIIVDKEATLKRKEKIEELTKDLWI
jgi:hypothetical protein